MIDPLVLVVALGFVVGLPLLVFVIIAVLGARAAISQPSDPRLVLRVGNSMLVFGTMAAAFGFAGLVFGEAVSVIVGTLLSSVGTTLTGWHLRRSALTAMSVPQR